MSIKKIGMTVCTTVLAFSLIAPIDASAILLGNKADPTDANSRAVVKMHNIVNENTEEGLARTTSEVCSGVLIAPKWILTNGSCAGNFDPKNKKDWIQNSVITVGPDVETGEKVVPAAVHSAISDKGLDFGLIELKEPAKTIPARIATDNKELKRGTLLDLYGWGASMMETVNDEGDAVYTRNKVDTNKAEITSPEWINEKPGYKNQNTENFPNSNIKMLGRAKAVEADEGGPLFHNGSVYAILSTGYNTDPDFWDPEDKIIKDQTQTGMGFIAPVYAVNDWISSKTGINIKENNASIDEKLSDKSFNFKKDDGSEDKKMDYYYYNSVFKIDPDKDLIPYKSEKNTIPKGISVNEDRSQSSSNEESVKDTTDKEVSQPSEQEQTENDPNSASNVNSTEGRDSSINTGSSSLNNVNNDNTQDVIRENSSSDRGDNNESDRIAIRSENHEIPEIDENDIEPTDNLYKNRENKDKGEEKDKLSNSSIKDSQDSSVKKIDSTSQQSNRNVSNNSTILPQPNIVNSHHVNGTYGPKVDTGGSVDNIWTKVISYFK